MRKFLLVYNAKSSMLNTFFDIGHKLLSPETYTCNLCALTHDTLFENKTWKEFRTKTNIDMSFYHIDEFVKNYPDTKFNFPSILIQEGNQLKEIIPASEINTTQTVEELINKIKDAAY